MTPTLYQHIANFIHETRFEDLPPSLINVVKSALIDFVGVSIAGATQNSVASAMAYAKYSSSKEEATIFGHAKKTSVEFAAMINAISGHALDFDDVSWTTIGHPSVVVAPVCFALAQKQNASGRDIILAYALATEVMHKLASISMPSTSERGWHTTAVFGTFGALVAGAVLKKSSKEEIINALGLAASKTSGIRANFGTDTKAYHAGMACYSGLEALNLASFGMKSSPSSFEDTDGFLQVFADLKYKDEALSLGEPWDLCKNGLVFKRYPCCSGAHPAADIMERIRQKHTFDYHDIEYIEVGCSLLAPKELKCDFPQTALEAKFSMRYVIASMLVYGKLGLDEFTNTKIKNPKIQYLMQKIHISVDEEFAKLGFIGTSPTRIHIVFNDSKSIENIQLLAKGNPENPLSMDEIEAKFQMCTKNINHSEELFCILCDLENNLILNNFFKLLTSLRF